MSSRSPALHPHPVIVVKPPRVKESLVNMEYALVQVVHVADKPGGGSPCAGREVVRFHLNDAIVSNYSIDPDKLRPIGRMGGPTYVRTTDRFDMERPK